MLFSPSLNRFYQPAWEKDYVLAGDWPDDLIEVSGDVFAEFTSPKAGFVRTVVNDLPAWKEAPPLTREEQANIAENTKQQLLYAAKQKITGWQTDLLLGDISDEDRDKLILWRDYIRKLEAIDTSKSPDIEWPVSPQ